jgi:hypothetical protein
MFQNVKWTERGALAFILLILFGAVIWLGFEKTANWAEAKEFINILLPALTTFIGAALGYYFGKGAPQPAEQRTPSETKED